MHEHIAYKKTLIAGIPINKKLLGLAVLEISPTDLCNRTCSFCPRSDPASYPNKNLNMTVATAILLAEQLNNANYTGTVSIAGYGEPLLNPDILRIIDVFKDFNTSLITNADLIIKQKFTFEQLLSAGLSKIIISDYDNNPIFNTYASDKIIVKRYLDDGEDHYADYSFSNRAGAMWGISETSTKSCYIPSYKAVVDWDGTVLLCSHDWVKTTTFGNIQTTDFNDVWYSEKLSTIRKQLISGDRTCTSMCSGCSVAGDLMGKNYADLW